jgi:hypothetical protein
MQDSLHKKIGLTFKKETIKRHIWRKDLCGAENWDTSESRSEIPAKFEMWYCRRMKKIIWTDCVRNEEVLQEIK